MKNFLLLMCPLLIAINSYGQSTEFSWAGQLEGSPENRCIVTDANHNIYTTGYFGSGCAMDDFDPGPAIYYLATAGGNDVFISKLDSLGNFVWAKQIGGIGSDVGVSIIIDKNGDICLTGVFNGMVDFDPGAGTFYQVSSGLGDAFISKLDTAGNFIWAKKIGGTSDDGPISMVIDENNNIITTGGFAGTVDFNPGTATIDTATLTSAGPNDVFISKLDAYGNYIWAKKIGGLDGESANSIAVDTSCNVYITGSFLGTADFDPGAGIFNLNNSSTSYYDIFISKIDSSGNFVWAKSMDGIAHDGGLSIAVDNDKNVYTTGYFNDIVDFDPGPGVYTLTSTAYPSMYSSIFISKLDISGNFVWAKSIGGNSYDSFGNCILLDKNKNIYFTGAFWGTADFDPGIGVNNLTAIGQQDAFISQLDSSGNFVWVKQIGGPSYESGQSIFFDNELTMYNSGSFGGTVDFNPGAGVFNLTASVCGGIFIQKLRSSSVWPGDTDHNYIVDNNDLLPIGLFYGETGNARSSVSNSWQANKSKDWSIFQTNGADIKHADSNGDGIIDNNDTLAINLNFSLTHAFVPESMDVRMSNPDLYFVTNSSAAPGSMVDVEIWVGSSTLPVSNLYGLSFIINYDASLVQSATEELNYSTSWFATPGIDGIKIGVADALASKVYCAETRIDHFNSSGFGKIADFKFQLKNTIPTNTMMNFSFLNYTANDANGNPLLFNSMNDSVLVTPFASVFEKDKEMKISVYPNPVNNLISVYLSEPMENGRVEIYNLLGELILKEPIAGHEKKIDFKNQNNGVYFLKIISENRIVGIQKIIKQ